MQGKKLSIVWYILSTQYITVMLLSLILLSLLLSLGIMSIRLFVLEVASMPKVP